MRHDAAFADSSRRILRFLSGGPASVLPAALDGRVLLEATDRGTISVDHNILAGLASNGVVVRASHSVALSDHGASLARRLASPAPGSRNRHRDIGLVTVVSDSGPATVIANLAESPLAQLVRRKTKSGAPFLTQGEYEAGERLRADYTRGRIMPRLGANWSAAVASGKRAGGGIADLTDAALAARQRVEQAIVTVGPELSGILIDVCCFLKGLELVETERGWPIRSAKVVLKTALAALARHYSPSDGGRHRIGQSLHWGTDDYRPTMTV